MPDKTVQYKRVDGTTYTKKVCNKTTGSSFKRTASHVFYPRQENVDEVVQYLGTLGGPFTIREVIDDNENLSMHRNTAYKVIRSLRDDGRIVQEGSKYVLVNVSTENGTPTVSTESENNDNQQEKGNGEAGDSLS